MANIVRGVTASLGGERARTVAFGEKDFALVHHADGDADEVFVGDGVADDAVELGGVRRRVPWNSSAATSRMGEGHATQVTASETLASRGVSNYSIPHTWYGRLTTMRFAPLVLFVALALPASPHNKPPSTPRCARSKRKGFSGVVRVERGGVTLLEKGYGLANRADKTPFTPSTVVQIGSNTKDFTVVALLQLHERGKLEHPRLAVEVLPHRAGGQAQHHALAAREARRRLSHWARRRLRADDARPTREGRVRASAELCARHG